jgi:NAD(P)-dependent dehydrogenase (short-subunit alcohol dehydrogenase family)
MTDFGIAGNRALIPASSAGLGKAAAERMVAEGADVIINGRDKSKLERTVREFESKYDCGIYGHVADISSEEGATGLVDSTIEQFGGIDILVFNSGGPPSRPFLQTTDDDWYSAFDQLVMSYVRILRRAVPYLREHRGTVVTNVSISVKETLDDFVLSNSVRMGLVGINKTLSRELAPDVRINSVLPGPFDTGTLKMLERRVNAGTFDTYEEAHRDYTEDLPFGRMGDPPELADIIAFLASPKSAHIHGETIVVDSGIHESNL